MRSYKMFTARGNWHIGPRPFIAIYAEAAHHAADGSIAFVTEGSVVRAFAPGRFEEVEEVEGADSFADFRKLREEGEAVTAQWADRNPWEAGSTEEQ
jgi:hypothetical protein